MKLSLDHADQLIALARIKANEIQVPMNIVVLDASTYLKAFSRMDDAVLGSVDIAIRKAKTALLFQMNTEQVFEFCKPGGPSFGLENSNDGLIVFAGGIPLRSNAGEIIGALGVSGGAVEQDFAVAEFAAKTFQERLQSQERKAA